MTTRHILSLFYEEDTDLLTAGFDDGSVSALEMGANDDGSDISMEVETKDFSGGSLTTRKLFHYAKVDADTAGEDITVEMYVDGDLKRTVTQSFARGAASDKQLLSFPGGCIGFTWRLRFTYTGSTQVKIYAMACIWQSLRPA